MFSEGRCRPATLLTQFIIILVFCSLFCLFDWHKMHVGSAAWTFLKHEFIYTAAAQQKSRGSGGIKFWPTDPCWHSNFCEALNIFESSVYVFRNKSGTVVYLHIHIGYCVWMHKNFITVRLSDFISKAHSKCAVK